MKADSLAMTEAPLYPVSDVTGLGRRVRELRLRQGLKQSDVAGQELSIAYISRIESGQRRPDAKVVRLIAERLLTSEEYLVTGVGREEAAEAQLSLRYAELALHNGEALDAAAQLRRLLEAGSALPTALRSRALFLSARTAEVLGNFDEAVHLLEGLRRDGAGSETLAVHMALSRCYRECGDLARSIDVGESGLRLAADLGLTGCDDAIRLTATLAAAYTERGDFTYAAHLCQSAIEEAERVSSSVGRAAAYWNASAVAGLRGETAMAIGLAERALALMSDSDDDRNLARLRLQNAILLLRSPELVPDLEALLLRASEQLSASGSEVTDLCRCDLALGMLRARQGRFDEASGLAEQVLSAVPKDAATVVADAELLLGRVIAQVAGPESARRHYQAAARALTGASRDRGAATAWLELAHLAEEAGDVPLALTAFKAVAAATGVRAPSISVTSDVATQAAT